MPVSIRIPSAKFYWVRALLITLAALLLTGCASLFDPEASQEFNSHQVGVVNPENSIGQEIKFNHRLADSITVWFSQPDSNSTARSGTISIAVYKNVASTTPIFSSTISTASIAQYTPVQISLNALVVPETGGLFIEFSSVDSEVIVHGRLEDNYSGGQAHQNRKPINADLAFRLTYRYGVNELSFDIRQLMLSIQPIFQLSLILFLPGYAVVRVFRLNRKFSSPEQLGISVGLSLAIIPIIFLFSSTLGMRISSSTIKDLGIAFFALILSMILLDHPPQTWSRIGKRPRQVRINTSRRRSFLEFWALVGILGFAFIVRMIMIGDLATSAWVDSVHHGLITRIILNNGSLPETYLPYLDISTSAYHPGFHSSLVAFLELSDMDISSGMLLFGQALNAAIILSVYLLGVALTRKPTSGLIAALLTSTYSAMPAYYTSWGRYPQLAGLIILPVTFSLLIASNQAVTKRERISFLLCASLAFAGLLLVHYRVAAFLLCLFVAWLLSELTSSGQHAWRIVRRYLLDLLVLGALSFLLSAPWMIKTLQETILPRMTPGHPQATLNFFSDFSWHYLVPVFGKQLMALTAISLVWFFLKKGRISWVISCWIIFLFFLANLDALNLPGGSFVNNSSVAIMLFMPFSVMSGHLIDQLFTLWRQILKGINRVLLAIVTTSALLYFAWLGSRQIISILNPTTLLTRQADLIALKWIDQNIADDEVILINSFAWGYNLFAGSDGGAWIPALTGNPTIPPPVLYGLGSSAQKTDINNICTEVSRLATSPDELWVYLTSQQIEYIYIGARGGAISPSALAINQHFETLYHQDTTWFFHLLP